MGSLPQQVEQEPFQSSSFHPLTIPTLSGRLAFAIEAHRAGQTGQARAIYEAVLAEDHENVFCLHHLGVLLHQEGKNQTAAELVEKSLELSPGDLDARSNLIAIYRALGRPDAGIEHAQKGLALRSDFPQIYLNMGGAYEDKGDFLEALNAYQKALALNPRFIEASANIANVLRKMRQYDQAIRVCLAIIEQRPDAAEPYFHLGNCLLENRQRDDAEKAYRRALVLRPDYPEVHFQLGNVLQEKDLFELAAEAYEKAVSLRPSFAEAYIALGSALEGSGRPADSIPMFQKALRLRPNLLSLRVWLHHKRRSICDWDGIMEEETELLRLLPYDDTKTNPFPCLSLEAGAALHRAIASSYASQFDASVTAYQHERNRRCTTPGRKIKIGYVSADFYRHATALLMVELFERHDRSNFEVFAYSHGPNDYSELGLRVRNAFDRFIDIGDLSDDDAARLIYENETDILIDLKGFTKSSRTGIAARRPAPCQVNFIGYPGTMGASFIDYVIADPFVLPMDQQPHYAEKIVHLPYCYQPNDTRRQIADLVPTRADCGLPETGFVFCCFNNSYKLTPPVFDIWMRLLKQVPESVIWLLDAQQMVNENLCQEAEKRGVDRHRLIFAPRAYIPEHLARHRLADLFLDCLPYNAHTTASDALWAGLPVLTCAGATFAGRVAGSLLKNIGLPELIASSLEEYETLALKIAQDPELLRAIKRKLHGHRLTAPLFDIASYTRDLEKAYLGMWETWSSGREPEAFAVEGHARADYAAAIKRVFFRTCPLCESRDVQGFVGADCSNSRLYRATLVAEVSWLQCANCNHVFTEGYFDAETRAQHFAKTTTQECVGFDMENTRIAASRIVERIARHAPQEGVWADVNFGNASLLFAAAEWGFEPFGIEWRRDNAEVLRGLGIRSFLGKLEALDFDEKFSVITIRDWLDRQPYPQEMLRAARRLLRKDGIIYLSLPNTGSMVWNFLHANQANPYWSEVDLVHLFSRERLCALLREQGFKPVYFNIGEHSRAYMEVIAARNDTCE